ncbi:MAG TPA: ribonuclease E/G [Stellaceae bacterium]
MTRRLLLTVSPGEIWAALVEDGAPVALRLARTGGTPRAGDLYLGRVVALRPDLPAVLVDIGAERPGFLNGDDMPAGANPREGQAVVVAVRKAARADKAAGLTMNLTAEDVAKALVPADAAPPLLLHRRETALGDLLAALAAPAPDEIVIDDAEALAEARSWLKRREPDFAGALIHHRDEAPLFEAHGIAAIVETALAPRAAVPGGGAITIELTQAAVLIDVDGGGAGALAANLAAAGEVARQIRLRDLSGPMIVDFIGMKDRSHRDQVAAILARILGDTDMNYLGWTRLGHFELVRRRRRPSLTEQLFEHRPDMPPARTALTVALDALRRFERESRGAPGKRLGLAVHPEIAACLDGAAQGARRALEARLGYIIAITAETRPRDNVAIAPISRET